MIKVMFEKDKSFFIITIDKMKVLYWDNFEGKIWGGPLQFLPPDYENVKRKIMLSRNKIPASFIQMFYVPKEELAEYNLARNDKELLEIVIRDCKKNGCKLVDVKYE